MPERVLAFPDALAEVLEHARRLGAPRATEIVALSEAAGRVLSAPLVADRDQPPFDRATRDGYAVRAADGEQPREVVGLLRAGEVWNGPALGAQQAIEIMTGAPVPPGADAIVMVEHTGLAETMLTLAAGHTPQPGQNIVPRAAEAHRGDVLLPSGRLLGPAEIALAANCGAATLGVFARPRVAIVATGDELVELADTPAAHQIRNSNSYALRSLAEQEGAFARGLNIARDTREDLVERIAQGCAWDLLLLSGGVSMGKFDLVEEVLRALGAEFFFTGALIQPGRPIVFGRIPKRDGWQSDADGRLAPSPDEPTPWVGEWTYFFGLPGNPVSTQVCFHLFVTPLLRALAGRTDLAPAFVEARLATEVKGGAKVMRFLPAELTSTWEAATVRPTGWQGSGDLAANARANCYVVLPIGPERFAPGDAVRVLLR